MRPLPHLLLWALGLRAAETQTTSEERDALVRYARGRTPIVGIGVWHGVTTAVLRQAMREDGVLWAVDPFPAGRLGFSPQKPIAGAEVNRVTSGTVRWMRATGQAAAAHYQREQREPVSLIFIDGEFSHAVVKRPAAGDYRVQEEFGGTAEPGEPPAAVLAGAAAALDALDPRTQPVYARVDGILVNGRFLLMELELIEPYLFLQAEPAAPRRLATAVARRLTS